MSVLKFRHPDEFAEARATVMAAPKPAARPRPPLPIGAPARATAVLTDLRADDPSPAEQVAALKTAAERKIVAILNMRPLTTDWSARIAADWREVNTALYDARDRIERETEASLATLAPLTAKAGASR